MHLLGSRTRNEDIWGKEEKGKVRFLIRQVLFKFWPAAPSVVAI